MFAELLKGFSGAAPAAVPAAGSAPTGIAASSAASSAARGQAAETAAQPNLLAKFQNMEPDQAQKLIDQISQVMAPPPLPMAQAPQRPGQMAPMGATPAPKPQMQLRSPLVVPQSGFANIIGGQ